MRKDGGARPLARLSIALCLLCPASAGGCVGYLMGWSDEEVTKLRLIVAELEVKNAALVEENLRLRKELREKPRGAEETKPGARAPATSSARDASGTETAAEARVSGEAPRVEAEAAPSKE